MPLESVAARVELSKLNWTSTCAKFRRIVKGARGVAVVVDRCPRMVGVPVSRFGFM